MRRLTAVTTLIHDNELDQTYPEKYATIIEVATRDGEVHRRRVDYALGSPQNPMSDADVIAKFHRLAGQRFSAERIAQIEQIVLTPDESGTVDELMRAITDD